MGSDELISDVPVTPYRRGYSLGSFAFLFSFTSHKSWAKSLNFTELLISSSENLLVPVLFFVFLTPCLWASLLLFFWLNLSLVLCTVSYIPCLLILFKMLLLYPCTYISSIHASAEAPAHSYSPAAHSLSPLLSGWG